jgi:hypothetical protein
MLIKLKNCFGRHPEIKPPTSNFMMPSYRTGFIAAAAFLGLSGAFCSPLTAGTLNGQAGWTASSNANYNISVVSGGLDYPGLSLDGGANHSIVAANSNTAS